jgi:hypothetical protein
MDAKRFARISGRSKQGGQNPLFAPGNKDFQSQQRICVIFQFLEPEKIVFYLQRMSSKYERKEKGITTEPGTTLRNTTWII